MTYLVWQVALPIAVLYALSNILVKKNKISLLLHKKIWNILLLLCFLTVGVLGVMMALGIYPVNGLFIHVEFGIALATIATFHILWHLYYFKALFKK
jgi:hypothetical protein